MQLAVNTLVATEAATAAPIMAALVETTAMAVPLEARAGPAAAAEALEEEEAGQAFLVMQLAMGDPTAAMDLQVTTLVGRAEERVITAAVVAENITSLHLAPVI